MALRVQNAGLHLYDPVAEVWNPVNAADMLGGAIATNVFAGTAPAAGAVVVPINLNRESIVVRNVDDKSGFDLEIGPTGFAPGAGFTLKKGASNNVAGESIELRASAGLDVRGIGGTSNFEAIEDSN